MVLHSHVGMEIQPSHLPHLGDMETLDGQFWHPVEQGSCAGKIYNITLEEQEVWRTLHYPFLHINRMPKFTCNKGGKMRATNTRGIFHVVQD